MNAVTQRVFEDVPAIRAATPLLIGLVGPSGGGKTYSALRMATGIQRIAGGDIYGIDTESNRMLHYADQFKFRHVPFRAPFGSLDYLAAIEHCVKKGAKTIIVDSMSHEHEGPGGLLEVHQQETERLAAQWKCSLEKAQLPAWSKPKQDRRRLINTILQLNANIIFCFRAKEKMKIVPGKQPVDLGYMAIAGEEFVFEMTLCCLLPPSAKGVPLWQSQYDGERAMMKLPGQFSDLFGQPKQLDEDTGVKLAQWAAGTPPAPTVAEYDACADSEALATLEKRRADNWKALPAGEKAALKKASEAAAKRIATAAPGSTTTTPTQDQGGAYTVESAIEALRACTDETALLDTWKRISDSFDGDAPLDIEAVKNEMKEALQL